MSRAETLRSLAAARDAMTLAMDALRVDDIDEFVEQLARANEALGEVAVKVREAA